MKVEGCAADLLLKLRMRCIFHVWVAGQQGADAWEGGKPRIDQSWAKVESSLYSSSLQVVLLFRLSRYVVRIFSISKPLQLGTSCLTGLGY